MNLFPFFISAYTASWSSLGLCDMRVADLIVAESGLRQCLLVGETCSIDELKLLRRVGL